MIKTLLKSIKIILMLNSYSNKWVLSLEQNNFVQFSHRSGLRRLNCVSLRCLPHRWREEHFMIFFFQTAIEVSYARWIKRWWFTLNYINWCLIDTFVLCPEKIYCQQNITGTICIAYLIYRVLSMIFFIQIVNHSHSVYSLVLAGVDRKRTWFAKNESNAMPIMQN